MRLPYFSASGFARSAGRMGKWRRRRRSAPCRASQAIIVGGINLDGIGAIVTKCRKDNFCRECGILRPYNAKRYCERCAAVKIRETQIKNMGRVRAWAQANKERMNRIKREWRKSHPLQKAKATRKWARANQEHLNVMAAARGKQRREATPRWANKFFIVEIYKLAALRRKVTGVNYTVDHIVPLRSPIVCGLHVENNLAIIPCHENLAKRNFYW